jgi:hypothetical protein
MESAIDTRPVASRALEDDWRATWFPWQPADNAAASEIVSLQRLLIITVPSLATDERAILANFGALGAATKAASIR